MKSFPFIAVPLFALLLGGCDTINHRIEKKPEVFASLDAADQAKIKKGEVDIGFTYDMVYFALGAPDEKTSKVTAAGQDTTWFFNSYYEDYEGTMTVGYRRFVVYDPGTRTNRVYFQPIQRDIYTPRVEERIRIVFKDGRVTAIEQTK